MRFLGDDVYTIADFNNDAKFANLGSATALEIGPGESVVATATDSGGNSSEFSPMKTVGTITSVAESGESVPKTFVLHQDYPNPFNTPKAEMEWRCCSPEMDKSLYESPDQTRIGRGS